MTGMADREARLLDAVYRTYGLAAVWTPVDGSAATPLTVRHSTEDVEAEYGAGRDVRRRNLIHVRLSEAPAAAAGDRVALTTPPRAFRVIAQPRLEANGLEWLCEVAED